MNQIPNIEETHNSRELEEKYWNSKPKKKVTGEGVVVSLSKNEFNELLSNFHQQLQKAREEERGKAVELMKIQIATGVAPSCEFILKSIISSLDHSELDHLPDRPLNQERE